MFVINHRKIFFILSGLLVAGAIAVIAVWGLRFGIDFTGGALMEITYTSERPALSLVEESMSGVDVGSTVFQETGEKGLIVRIQNLDEEGRLDVLDALSLGGGAPFTEDRFASIGPVIGNELKQKAWIALVVVVVAIILFIALVFRKVSEPVSSWKYGLVAVLALAHDVIIPTGIFAILGHFFINYQVDVLFVTALLVILGYSVNDTIVVFDRVRENLKRDKEGNNHEAFPEIVGRSLRQTIGRSVNTALTTLLVLVALFFLGGSTTEHFALTLIIGIVAGTYSSIFLASPLLVVMAGKQVKK